MYINNVLLDKRSKSISESLPHDTIKRILHLLLKNQKIKNMNTDKINIVRIIIINIQIGIISYYDSLLIIIWGFGLVKFQKVGNAFSEIRFNLIVNWLNNLVYL